MVGAFVGLLYFAEAVHRTTLLNSQKLLQAPHEPKARTYTPQLQRLCAKPNAAEQADPKVTTNTKASSVTFATPLHSGQPQATSGLGHVMHWGFAPKVRVPCYILVFYSDMMLMLGSLCLNRYAERNSNPERHHNINMCCGFVLQA